LQGADGSHGAPSADAGIEEDAEGHHPHRRASVYRAAAQDGDQASGGEQLHADEWYREDKGDDHDDDADRLPGIIGCEKIAGRDVPEAAGGDPLALEEQDPGQRDHDRRQGELRILQAVEIDERGMAERQPARQRQAGGRQHEDPGGNPVAGEEEI
jgi:hypothetical protein